MRLRFHDFGLCLGLALALAALPRAGRAAVTVTVSPPTVDLLRGQSQQFSARVDGEPQNAAVSIYWSLSGIGTLTTSGYYTAPNSVFGTSPVTVTVYANASVTSGGVTSNYRGSATVRLIPTVAVTLTPANVTLQANQAQQFTATVTGTANTGVSFVITPAIGTITPGGLYTAPPTIVSQTSVTLTATSAADPTKSDSANITLMPSGISVSVSPKTVTLTPSQTQQFTAAVSGASGSTVIWSINPPNLGTISTAGLYTAPPTITTNQTVTVTAASAADPNRSSGTATVTLTPATVAVDVGAGAPSSAIRDLFVQAFYRKGFHNLVSLPPVGLVRKWGSTGFIQEFYDTNKTSGVRLALVKPNLSVNPSPTAPEDQPLVFQITAPLQSYYSSVGVATAGYPTMDAEVCPFFDAVNSCVWAQFDKGYALFAYTNTLYTGQNFTVRGAFYTKWAALGGLSGPGRPVDAEVAATSSAGAAATMQTYANGVIYSFTSGPMNGQVYGVVQPAYALYLSNGGHGGFLGFPISNEIVLADGTHRQTFQGGSIEWNPGSDPHLRLPVAAVSVSASGAVGGVLRLQWGETAQATAAMSSFNGVELLGRAVSWTSTNSRVVAIEQSGATVLLRAVGGGAAQVTASSEGKSSRPLTVLVDAPCCMVGEGAPTPAIQQAFLDAVARHKLSIVLPAASPVERAGAGYIQELQSAEPGAPAALLLSKPDRVATAYLVRGEILRRYRELGGPAGSLGHAISDATPGGRQLFENAAALAGDPALLVSGPVPAKWAVLGYETGAAGLPAAEAARFQTWGANAGVLQAFGNGIIYAATAGPRAGQAYFVSGLVLERYVALGGPAGAFGMPVSDEFGGDNTRQQNFEGGSMVYAPGEAAAREQPAPRQPAVSVAPVTVAPGGRVRLAVLGFPAGSAVRVSVTGAPDFLVRTETGAYAWEAWIPLSAAPGVVTIRAAEAGGGAAAEGSYTVRRFADVRAQLVKLHGEGQAGLPGARLAQPFRVALRDASGNAIAGVPVSFEPSPGAQAVPAAAVTDEHGEAQVWLRLPPSEGVAGCVVNAPSVSQAPVTFFARAEAGSLANFPNLRQSGDAPVGRGTATMAQKGALLTAASAILRYHQNRGELPAPNGLADPGGLNLFLQQFCVPDAQGAQVCDGFLSNPEAGEQVVNLWRAGEFAGGGLEVEPLRPEIDAIRDQVAAGSPVLLSVALSAGGAPAGGHFVVAIGVAPNGTVIIHDPSPEFSRTNLHEYLVGFSAGGRAWKGELLGAARLALRAPAPSRFLVAVVSQPPALLAELGPAVRSGAGACGPALDLPDAAPASSPRVSRFVACDGAAAAYLLQFGGTGGWQATVSDFAAGGAARTLSGSGPAAWRASRPVSRLEIAPQDAGISAVLNAATFTPAIAPGGLVSIFGAGLAGPDGGTAVEIGGRPAVVLAATPFQVNAQVPPDLAPGSYTVRVASPYGTAERPVEVRAVAPAIFVVAAGRGAVVNAGGAVNAPAAPAARGSVILIYATGLGAMERRGALSVVSEPVTVVLNGQVIRPDYAGAAPGFAGLYQINVLVPSELPPGIDLPLFLRQAGAESNMVGVSLE